MAEEFYESDVIFSDEYDSSSSSSGGGSSDFGMAVASSHRNVNHRGHKKQRKSTKQNTGSVPIWIPDNIFVDSSSSDELGYEKEQQVMPPHLIVAKRLAERMGGGYGRALKGRELNQVRNSILRMTGFLET